DHEVAFNAGWPRWCNLRRFSSGDGIGPIGNRLARISESLEELRHRRSRRTVLGAVIPFFEAVGTLHVRRKFARRLATQLMAVVALLHRFLKALLRLDAFGSVKH